MSIYDPDCFNAQGRTIRETRSWKNIAFTTANTTTNADDTVYDYGTDPVNPWPLVATRRIEGKVVSKTFSSNFKQATASFLPSSFYYVKIANERAASADSVQGSVSNQISYELYCGDQFDAASRGALKASVHEDGRMESYDYSFGTFLGTNNPSFSFGSGTDHRTVRTHGTSQFPGGVANRTTREITIRNAKGQVVFEETQVSTDSGYQRVSWMKHQYDTAGNRIRTDYPDGTYREWDFTAGRMKASRERDGIWTTYGYDNMGRLSSTTLQAIDPTSTRPAQVSRITTKIYDALNRVVVNMQSAGDQALVSQAEYDILGRAVVQTDPAGLVTTYSYAPNGRGRTVIQPSGLVSMTTNFIDGQVMATYEEGLRKSVYDTGVNSDGTRWNKTYVGSLGTNSPQWEKSTSDFLGRSVMDEKPGYKGAVITNIFNYNIKGQIIASGNNIQPPMLYAYDDLGEQWRSALDVNSNSQIDLEGPDKVNENIRRYVQRDGDWYTEATSIIYPVNSTPLTNSVSRTSAGGLSCGCAAERSEQVDLLGNVTVNESAIDPVSHFVVRKAKSPFSTNSVTSVTCNGLLIESTSATSVKTTYVYDVLGRQIAAIQGDATSHKVGNFTMYNQVGQVESTMDLASNKTTYVYDDVGRRVQVIDALTNSTYTAYDAEGRTLATWGATYPVAYEYDEFGRMTAMYTYRGTSVISSYSEISNLKSQMDRTRWLYDQASGLLTNKLYADNKGPSYTYTPDGKLKTRTWARGVVTTYNYDSFGQMTNISYSDSTPAVSFTFDRLGRQVTITDSTGTRAFTYNDALQLTTETNTFGALNYAFDSFGRSSGFTAGSNYSVSYGYSPIGRFSTLSSTIGTLNPELETLNYSYLPGSDLVAGYTSDSGFSAMSTFEPNRNLITSLTNSFGGTQMHRFDYSNDEIGRRIKRTDYDLSVVISNLYAYNMRSELEDAAMGTNSFSYRYDPIGNRRFASNVYGLESNVSTYAANSLNQYSAISNQQSQIAPTYDLDGNMLTYKDWTFGWDAENRLVMASNSTTVLNFSYDYMSRRVTKTVNGQTTQFKYQGWAMFEENTSSTTNSYVYGLDLSGSQQGAGTIGGILVGIFNGTSAFYAYDANGNVTDLVGTNGQFLAKYQFDPYGNTISKSGVLADVNPFRFSTKYLDAETGLYYYGYRYYQPETGRWLGRDPVEERGGINLNCFVANRVPNCVDTDGRFVYPIIINPPDPPPPSDPGTPSECAELRKFLDSQRQIRDAYQKSIGTCENPQFPPNTGIIANPGMRGCFKLTNRFVRSICIAHESCHWRHVVIFPTRIFCAKDTCERLDVIAKEEVPCYDSGILRGEELYKQYCTDPNHI